MTDYYSILNVPKGASDTDIKKQYRNLAREHHPDKGGNKEEFQKIQEAYETLSNPEKRAEYDNPQPNININNGGFHFNFDMFGQQHFHQQQSQPIKRSDHNYTCKVTLKDIYFGTVKKIKVQRKRICNACQKQCSTCNGNGRITQQIQMGPFAQIIQQSCNNCSGSGKVVHSECDVCNSKGYHIDDRIFEIEIERGIESGKQFIYNGWGEQATNSNEISGQLIINVRVDADANFKRAGLNLYYTQSLSLKESLIGTNISIPHFEAPVELDVSGFGIINPNKEYIVFGKGLQDASNKKGNLHIKFDISYPDKSFSKEELVLLNDVFDKVNF